MLIVPPVATLMAKTDVNKFDLSSLNQVWCAAAPLGQDLEQDILRKFKLPQVKQGIQRHVHIYLMNVVFVQFLSLTQDMLFFSKP